MAFQSLATCVSMCTFLYWFEIRCTLGVTTAPVALLLTIHISFIHDTTLMRKKCTSQHVTTPNWPVALWCFGAFKAVKYIISCCVTQKKLFCPYRKAEMKLRHDEIRRKYGKLSHLLKHFSIHLSIPYTYTFAFIVWMQLFLHFGFLIYATTI